MSVAAMFDLTQIHAVQAAVKNNGNVDASTALAVVKAVEIAIGPDATQETRNQAFTDAGLDSAARLNLAEALLPVKDAKPEYAQALSVLNQSYGLESFIEADAAKHHRKFFGKENLKRATEIYKANGGTGNFLDEVRKLSDEGGTDNRKQLVIAVLAYSYATQLGLDTEKLSLNYFRDHPSLQGINTANGEIGINKNTEAWANQFARVVNTVAHEITHEFDRKQAAAYAAGEIKETLGEEALVKMRAAGKTEKEIKTAETAQKSLYLHAKASYINFLSYNTSGDTAESHKAYEKQHVEARVNAVGKLFGLTAEGKDDIAPAVIPTQPAFAPSARTLALVFAA